MSVEESSELRSGAEAPSLQEVPLFVETLEEVAVPGLAPEPGSFAETLALRLAGKNRTWTVPFGTEAGHFQAAGIPTVVFGPCGGGAHATEEWVDLSSVEKCREVLTATVRAFCA